MSRSHMTDVTVYMKYLEEQLQVMDPVIEVMKNAVEKSKTWIEDKNDNTSFTYVDLYQELESANIAVLGVASHIISENKDYLGVNRGTSSPSTSPTTSTDTRDQSEIKSQINKQVKHTAEILTRLELVEKALSSLRDTKQKAEYDISEIKQWRDNFLSERNDTALKTEQFGRQEKENIESLRQQISEQDNKVKELIKEIESLKEKESTSNKTLEKLSLDLKEYENNLHKINKEMQDHTDKTDSITQEVRIHCSIISALQEDTAYKFKDIFTKLEDQFNKILMLDNQANEDLKFLTDFYTPESRVCVRYGCHLHLAHNTPVSGGSVLSTFSDVREYNGQHFNQTTGKFVCAHEGLYLVCITLHEREDKQIRVSALVDNKWYSSVVVKSADTSAAGSVVVDIKKGQELYFKVTEAEEGAKLTLYSSFTIVSL